MKITKDYIRGAFDGEGYLSKTGHGDREWWVLGITNSDLLWLLDIENYLKSRGYHPFIERHGRSGFNGRKTTYTLKLRRRSEIRIFIIAFPPLMVARQRKVAEFLMWDKEYPSRRRGLKWLEKNVNVAI